MSLSGIKFRSILENKVKRKLSEAESKAIVHHFKYCIRANNILADFGTLRISRSDYKKELLGRINRLLDVINIERYCREYQNYKDLKKNYLLLPKERNIIEAIAEGKNTVSDYDTEKLQIIYTKYLEQILMPEIEKISHQHNLSYHGLWHTEQVAAYGLYYALNMKENPLPVLILPQDYMIVPELMTAVIKIMG